MLEYIKNTTSYENVFPVRLIWFSLIQKIFVNLFNINYK